MLTVVILDKLLRPLPARINTFETAGRIPRGVLQCFEEFTEALESSVEKAIKSVLML